jgi:hypothetical protein
VIRFQKPLGEFTFEEVTATATFVGKEVHMIARHVHALDEAGTGIRSGRRAVLRG